MRKNTRIHNFLLLLICGVLAVFFVSFLAWNAKTEAATSKKLMQEAQKTSQEEKAKVETKQEDKKEQQGKEETEEEQPEETKIPAGISFWGDEFFPAENE